MSADVRSRMIEGAVRLLATEGVEGTSFANVLAATDSPRGSVYHHFPGGKAELVREALDFACEAAMATMEAARGKPARAVVQQFLDLWRELLIDSDLRAGCVVMAVTVAAGDESLRKYAGDIFRRWTEQLIGLFAEAGVDRRSARQLATTLISAMEGAVALSRAEQSSEPFEDVCAALLRLADTLSKRTRPK